MIQNKILRHVLTDVCKPFNSALDGPSPKLWVTEGECSHIVDFSFNFELLSHGLSTSFCFNVVLKAWVWKTQADFADALCEEDKPKQEVN